MKKSIHIKLVTWDVAKRGKHNCTPVETPNAWLYIKIKGVYHPYQIA